MYEEPLLRGGSGMYHTVVKGQIIRRPPQAASAYKYRHVHKLKTVGSFVISGYGIEGLCCYWGTVGLSTDRVEATHLNAYTQHALSP